MNYCCLSPPFCLSQIHSYCSCASQRCSLCLTRQSLWWTTVLTWQSRVASRWSVTCWQRVAVKVLSLWHRFPSPFGPVLWNVPWSTAESCTTFTQRTSWWAHSTLFLFSLGNLLKPHLLWLASLSNAPKVVISWSWNEGFQVMQCFHLLKMFLFLKADLNVNCIMRKTTEEDCVNANCHWTRRFIGQFMDLFCS